MIWTAPSFISFTVPYGITRDFFYSGHTGMMFFCSLWWKQLGHQWIFRISLLLTIFVVLVLLSTRVHYSIDIIGGVFFTLWIRRFLLPHVKYFDLFWSTLFNLLFKMLRYIKSLFF